MYIQVILAFVGLVIATVVIAAVVETISLATPTVQTPEPVVEDVEPPPTPVVDMEIEQSDMEMLFMAATTILALAVFGSALSAQMQRKPRHASLSERMVIPFFILILVVVQAWFMFHLAGIYADNSRRLSYFTVVYWISATAVCLILIPFLVTILNYPADGEAGAGPS